MHVNTFFFTKAVYKGISESSWTKSLTKCLLTCVVGHCCTLQNSPLLGLCNGSCVSATAGTGFLGSHVEWSVIVPNFNDTLEMVPS
jgi:hypothetical protein